MKTFLYCIFFLLTSLTLLAQTPCSNVKLLDKGIWENYLSWPLHRLRKYDNMDKIPLALQEKIKAAIIEQTSLAFFEQLQVKQVRTCDSATKERLNIYMDFYDSLGNRINNFYFIYYEIKLNGKIPFVFRLNFNDRGKMFDVESGDNNLKYITAHLNKIISCDKAVELALKDNTAPIKEAKELFLFYYPREKLIIWQAYGPLKKIDEENGIIDVKLMDAVTGHIVMREQAKWYSPVKLEEIKAAPEQLKKQ